MLHRLITLIRSEERGVEKHVELDNLSAAEVEARVVRLLQS